MSFVFHVTVRDPRVFSLNVPILLIALLLLFQVSFSTLRGAESYEYTNCTVKTPENKELIFFIHL